MVTNSSVGFVPFHLPSQARVKSMKLGSDQRGWNSAQLPSRAVGGPFWFPLFLAEVVAYWADIVPRTPRWGRCSVSIPPASFSSEGRQEGENDEGRRGERSEDSK